MTFLLTFFDKDITQDMAESCINSFINSQVLVNEIEPIITGDKFFDHILSVLKQAMPDLEIYGRLNEISELLQQLNGGETKNNIEDTGLKIEEIIKSLNHHLQRRWWFNRYIKIIFNVSA